MIEIIIALAVGFVIGCLVGANNAKRVKDTAAEVKTEASAAVDKASSQ